MKRINILNCPVDNLNWEEVIAQIESFIESGQPHQAVVVNAAKLWRMERDPKLDRVVKAAALILPEKAIVIGSKILGEPLKEPILGISLIKQLIAVATLKEYRIYFLGAQEEIVSTMVEHLERIYPGIQIVGWHNGYFSSEQNDEVIEQIRMHHPDLLFIALGTPKQEYWVSDNLQKIGVPFCLGVGGSFDVLSGRKKDAPGWVRAFALEWLYRLIQDPRNLFKRYAITIPWFLYRIFKFRLLRLKKAEYS